MAKKISDFIVMSDVDGTLITPEKIIPPRNIEALQRFTQGGGRFALSTGRSILYTKELVKKLPINFPCVLFNGGMLYDYQKQETLHQIFLPRESRTYFLEIAENFPDAEVLVVDREHYNEISPEQNRRAHHSDYRTRFASIDDIPLKDWYKGLIILSDSRMKELIAFLDVKQYPGVRFVNTLNTAIEMLPFGCSKGEALTRLMQMEQFDTDSLAVIGDYYNDREMIQLAGLGVTLNTSPDDLKAEADLVVGPCKDGAVADLIEYLEAHYGY